MRAIRPLGPWLVFTALILFRWSAPAAECALLAPAGSVAGDMARAFAELLARWQLWHIAIYLVATGTICALPVIWADAGGAPPARFWRWPRLWEWALGGPYALILPLLLIEWGDAAINGKLDVPWGYERGGWTYCSAAHYLTVMGIDLMPMAIALALMVTRAGACHPRLTALWLAGIPAFLALTGQISSALSVCWAE